MDTEILIANGEAIGWGLVGAIAVFGLIVIQLFRRRGDRKQAKMAVHLAGLSISEPRLGPIAVTGSYHESKIEHWLECGGQRVSIDGAVDVVRGSRARWQRGVRTYSVRPGDDVIAIGVMSKQYGWTMRASPEQTGVLVYAKKPVAKPPPLLPWRALLYLVICGGIGLGGLYVTGTQLLDTKACDDAWRFEYATALPLVRDDALDALARCR